MEVIEHRQARLDLKPNLLNCCFIPLTKPLVDPIFPLTHHKPLTGPVGENWRSFVCCSVVLTLNHFQGISTRLHHLHLFLLPLLLFPLYHSHTSTNMNIQEDHNSPSAFTAHTHIRVTLGPGDGSHTGTFRTRHRGSPCHKKAKHG